MKYYFNFYAIDNGGGRKSFTVKAADKSEAIFKGLEIYRKKYARGDINSWTCTLIRK